MKFAKQYVRINANADSPQQVLQVLKLWTHANSLQKDSMPQIQLIRLQSGNLQRKRELHPLQGL